MKNFKELFHKIDDGVFRQVDTLKNESNFLKVVEKVESLPDHIQKIAFQSISYGVILLPMFALLIVYIINHGVRSDIADRKEAIELIYKFNSKKSKAQGITNAMLSKQTFSSKDSFQSYISSLMNRMQVPAQNLAVKKFEISEKGDLQRTNATINFRGLTTPTFSKMIQNFIDTEKMKVLNIKIKREARSRTLNGSFEIFQFGRQEKKS